MALSIRQTSVRPMRAARPARAVQPVKAMLSPAVAIGGATCAMLVLGRFVFLPFQRRELDYQQEIAGPKTTGSSYFDKLQQQSTFTLQSKDPSKFGFIDVLGWGALGHVLGFAALAASSLADSGVTPFPR
ncbi:psaK-domain-containing protein [Haematococcus lacustris]